MRQTRSISPGSWAELAFRHALTFGYAVAAAALTWAIAAGWSFYTTPLALRARHPGYWTFKAGGSVGHVLGLAGSVLLVLLLVYSLRKRARVLRRLGPLSRWLDVHIFMGIVGPLLVVLHSTFKVGGLVALSFWSMVLVALSGVVGRYLYQQIPRARNGEALSLAEAERLDAALLTRLREEFGLDDAALQRLDALSTPPAAGGLLRLAADSARRGRVLRQFTRECGDVPPDLLRRLARVVREKDAIHRRLAMWDRLHALFHYWHVVHKPFAVVMYVFMAVHVAVALMTGYGWGLR